MCANTCMCFKRTPSFSSLPPFVASAIPARRQSPTQPQNGTRMPAMPFDAPFSVSGTSTQPVNRFSKFHALWPWRIKTRVCFVRVPAPAPEPAPAAAVAAARATRLAIIFVKRTEDAVNRLQLVWARKGVCHAFAKGAIRIKALVHRLLVNLLGPTRGPSTQAPAARNWWCASRRISWCVTPVLRCTMEDTITTVLRAAPDGVLAAKVLRRTSCKLHQQVAGADLPKAKCRALFQEALLDLSDVGKVTFLEDGSVALSKRFLAKAARESGTKTTEARAPAPASADEAVPPAHWKASGYKGNAKAAPEFNPATKRKRGASDASEDDAPGSADGSIASSGGSDAASGSDTSSGSDSESDSSDSDGDDNEIWNARAVFAAPKQARRKHKSRAQRTQRAAALRVDPQVELLRLRKMKALRSKLTRLCSKHKLRMPVLAFERWLSRCKLHERWAGDQHCDPLIPSTGWRDKGLVKDLKRVLASEEIAKEISAAMSDAALVASEEVATAAKAAARGEQVYATNANKASKATSDGTDDGSDVDSGDAAKSTEGPLEVVVVERGHTLALSLGEGNKPYMVINHSHFKKLQLLYQRHRPTSETQPEEGSEKATTTGSGAGDGDAASTGSGAGSALGDDSELGADIKAFIEKVFCMLVRYEALKGHGYQAAVSGNVFDFLLEHLQVQTECFASPLNCRYEWCRVVCFALVPPPPHHVCRPQLCALLFRVCRYRRAVRQPGQLL